MVSEVDAEAYSLALGRWYLFINHGRAPVKDLRHTRIQDERNRNGCFVQSPCHLQYSDRLQSIAHKICLDKGLDNENWSQLAYTGQHQYNGAMS